MGVCISIVILAGSVASVNSFIDLLVWVFAWIGGILPSWLNVWRPFSQGFPEGGWVRVMLVVECFLWLECPCCYRRRPWW